MIRLTAIEGRAIAIVPSEIVSIEKGDYTERYNRLGDFKGAPTIIILKHHLKYVVEEDFDTVRKLIGEADNDI